MTPPPVALNSAQMKAVHHLTGPCLVLAGAGSGKTRVIGHKIARLLQSGLAPKQIAAITFTNKAAAEMRERARALVDPRAAKDLAVSTFHSLGVRGTTIDNLRRLPQGHFPLPRGLGDRSMSELNASRSSRSPLRQTPEDGA